MAKKLVSGMQDPQLDRIAQLNSNNLTQDREKLPRGDVYRMMYLEVEYQLDVAAADNTQANVARGDGAAVLDEINVQVTGNQDIKNYSGPLLRAQNYRYFGQLPYRSAELGNGEADPHVHTILAIPFFKPDAVNPWEYSLDSSAFRNVSIEWKLRDADDVVLNANGFLQEPIGNVHAKMADIDTLRAERGDPNFSIWREQVVPKDINQGGEITVELPLDGMIPGMNINTIDDGNATGPGYRDAPDLVDSVRLESATDTPVRASRALLEMGTPLWEGHSREFDGATYQDQSIGDDNNLDGHFFYTHPDDGLQSEAFDPKGQNLSEFNAVIDVPSGQPTGNAKALIKVDQIFPPRTSNNGGGS